MKKIVSCILTLAVIIGAVSGASAYGVHTEEKYLTDTLTLAGSAFDGVRTVTVSALESMAVYENEYSLMTSGSVFSKHTFAGVKLYDLLINEGMEEDIPDSTPVKCISKDGYTIPLTIGDLRSDKYCRYSEKGGELEETGLPVIAAFSSDGERLVGPTGTESVYKQFGEADGYIEEADNIGGPLRLIIGQTDSYEFNAPNCSKWLAAVVVGDANGYVYTRDTDAKYDDSEPERGGDWTHGNTQQDYTLTVSGTESKGKITLSLKDIETKYGKTREYFASSAGRYAFEGVSLRDIIKSCIGYRLDAPTKITIKAADGFSKMVDVSSVMNGIDSLYQPGRHRDIILAWAVDGSPLVPTDGSEGYDGMNAYGPLRLIVENTVSLWVKNVTEIVLGEERDEIKREDYIYNMWLANGSPASSYKLPCPDVQDGMYYTEAIRWSYETGLIFGYPNGRFGTGDYLWPEHEGFILERYEKIFG